MRAKDTIHFVYAVQVYDEVLMLHVFYLWLFAVAFSHLWSSSSLEPQPPPGVLLVWGLFPANTLDIGKGERIVKSFRGPNEYRSRLSSVTS